MATALAMAAVVAWGSSPGARAAEPAGNTAPTAMVPAAGAAVAKPDPTRAFLEARLRSDPDDSTAWNRLGALELAGFRREGDFAALRRAEHAAAESLRAVPAEANPGGLALTARVAQASHRFQAARRDAERLAGLAPERAEGWRLLAEACVELGDFSAAEEAAMRQARVEPGTVATELCLAGLALARGERSEARRRLETVRAHAEAMTPPDAELIAWCDVRLGRLAFSAGELEKAESLYRTALVAWPGWYVAEDHLAEALAARGGFDSALALYRPLAERLRRPEIWQALGDVLMAAGKDREAGEWYRKARAAYLASAEAGETLYLHHLAGFFSDAMPEPEAAVRWARRDLETRGSMGAWDALGRALHRAGRHAEAVEAEERALAFPAAMQDAHLLFNAAVIFCVAGDAARGNGYLRAAFAVNPRCDGFHTHR